MKPRFMPGLAAALAFATWVTIAHAQVYPTRAITLVVPFAVGGPTDVLARTLGASMAKTLGQTVVIENKLGAGGTIAANAVAKATPDGYTVLIHHNGMATAPALYRRLPYNPMTDFEYVGQIADVPMTLLARKDMAADNLRELVAYVRANNDKINLANAGLGAVSHLCAMLFQQAVGVELTTVPFQGTGPAMTALLGGQVDMLCDQTTQTLPHIKAQKVKFYGVTTKRRIEALPAAPTMDEQGLEGFEVVLWHGIYMPRNTPKETVDRLNRALREALRDPAVSGRLADLGAQIVPETQQTSTALRDWLKSEIDKWGPVIRKAGLYAD